MDETPDNLVSLILLLLSDVNKSPDPRLSEGQVFDSRGNIITL